MARPAPAQKLIDPILPTLHHSTAARIETAERPPRILRPPEVRARVQLSRPTIWRLVRDGKFPAPLRLSSNAVGYLESEISAWIEARSRTVTAPIVAAPAPIVAAPAQTAAAATVPQKRPRGRPRKVAAAIGVGG